MFVPRFKLFDDRVKVLVLLYQLKCYCFYFEHSMLNVNGLSVPLFSSGASQSM